MLFAELLRLQGHTEPLSERSRLYMISDLVSEDIRVSIGKGTYASSPPIIRPHHANNRKHPVNPSCQLGGAGRPAMREQFGDVGRLVGRQSREDVFQIGVGIVPVELGRLDQAHDGSRALTGAQ